MTSFQKVQLFIVIVLVGLIAIVVACSISMVNKERTDKEGLQQKYDYIDRRNDSLERANKLMEEQNAKLFESIDTLNGFL